MTGSRRGLDGVVAADSVLGFVDGAAGVLCFAGRPVDGWAGVRPWSEVAATLLALGADTPVDVDFEAALGAARERAWGGLPSIEAVLRTSPNGVAAVRGGLAGVVGDDAPATVLGAVAVLTAAWMRLQAGRAPIAPDPAAGHAADLLRMCLGVSDPDQASGLDAYLTTVVDHGLNASTFTARVVASTRADDVAVVAAALSALEGPLHGGAPGPVLDMLDAIGKPAHAESWVRAELAAGRRIMGLGHRVYRTRDPRAAVLERVVHTLPGSARSRLPLARAVEAAATHVLAERHPDRPLRANVEFGTAVLLDALGFPKAAFTPLFGCSRAAGWLAHAAEQRRTGRLMRPRLRYVGVSPAA